MAEQNQSSGYHKSDKWFDKEIGRSHWEKRIAMLALKKAGLTQVEIGKTMGFTKQYVSNRLKKMEELEKEIDKWFELKV